MYYIPYIWYIHPLLYSIWYIIFHIYDIYMICIYITYDISIELTFSPRMGPSSWMMIDRRCREFVRWLGYAIEGGGRLIFMNFNRFSYGFHGFFLIKHWSFMDFSWMRIQAIDGFDHIFRHWMHPNEDFSIQRESVGYRPRANG